MSNNNNKRNEIFLFFPYGQHPNPEPIIYNEIERVFKYDSTKKNIILTDEIRNCQVEIDAFKEGTLIYDILDKYAGTPDLSQIPELNIKNGSYADISNLPDNIHDLQNIIKTASFKMQELKESNNEQVQTDINKTPETNQKDSKTNIEKGEKNE